MDLSKISLKSMNFAKYQKNAQFFENFAGFASENLCQSSFSVKMDDWQNWQNWQMKNL